MAANMQDTKFIFRRIELVIGVCGWIFFLHQTLSRRIWFRCKVLLPHSWTHLYQQYQQKWHPCPPSTPACSSGWGPWCAASADRSRSCSPCQNCQKRDFIFVHLFNETQLRNLVFSRQLFLRTIKGPFYRRGQSMDNRQTHTFDVQDFQSKPHWFETPLMLIFTFKTQPSSSQWILKIY